MKKYKLSSYVELELTSAIIDEAFQKMLHENISLYSIFQKDLLTIQFLVHQKDYARIRNLCIRQGWSVRIVKRMGVYWHFVNLGKRPILIFSVAAVILLTILLSSVILFVEVEGNKTIPKRQILECASECRISIGASRRMVRSEVVKNEMLSILPELKWVGINTIGCRAVISVREKDEDSNINHNGISNIVAKMDGIVDSILVTRGTPLCKPGQVVRKDQILISGYTDCDFTMLATGAEGEIYANTIRVSSAVMPEKWYQREEIIRQEKRYSIIVGKNRINLWKGSGIYPTTCGRISEEYYITLPGGFQFPIALAVDKLLYYADENGVIQGGNEMLSTLASDYLLLQMTAGVILQKTETVHRCADTWVLNGEYFCREMIGAVQPERIGEKYGENN